MKINNILSINYTIIFKSLNTATFEITSIFPYTNKITSISYKQPKTSLQMPLHCFSYINTNDKEHEREGKKEGERMEIDEGYR